MRLLTPRRCCLLILLLNSGCGSVEPPQPLPATILSPAPEAPHDAVAVTAEAAAPAVAEPTPPAVTAAPSAVPATSAPTPPPARTVATPKPPAALPTPPKIPAPAVTAPPAAAAQASAPTLDLKTLETRLKNTKAIGLMTKLSLKNQVDDLVDQFRAYHQGQRKNLADLRQPYDLLLMKVLTLLQDGDPALAREISASREALWNILADRSKFSTMIGAA